MRKTLPAKTAQLFQTALFTAFMAALSLWLWSGQAYAACDTPPNCRDANTPLLRCISCAASRDGKRIEQDSCRRLSIETPNDLILEHDAKALLGKACGAQGSSLARPQLRETGGSTAPRPRMNSAPLALQTGLAAYPPQSPVTSDQGSAFRPRLTR